MSVHPLMTDAAVEAAEPRIHPWTTTQQMLEAFIAHHEGERRCERCWGRSRLAEVAHTFADCPDCNGTGVQRADRLVSLNAVVEFVIDEGCEQDAFRIKDKFWGSDA